MTKEQKEIYKALCERDGKRCHYCGIEEKDVIPLWGEFYKQDKRGYRLELDRTDNERDYSIENCVLACAVCNCAKSNKFRYEEFRKVGAVIKEVWQQREKNGGNTMPPRVSDPQDFQSLLALYNITEKEYTRYRDREWINAGLFLASMATIVGFMMINKSLARSFAPLFSSILIALTIAHIWFSRWTHVRLNMQRNVRARIQYLLNFTDIQVEKKPLLPPELIKDINKSLGDDNCRRGWSRGFWSHLLPFWLATFLLAVFGIWFLWSCN